MKKLFYTVMLLLGLSIVGCQKDIFVTSVSLYPSSVTIGLGDSMKLEAIVLPSNATNQNVTWTSSNQSVVSVDNGKITALSNGRSTITIKSEDGGKTATCDVNVIIFASAISLNAESVELMQGDEFQLTAIIHPENTTNKELVWSSSNNAVAEVNEGNVIAHKVGEAIITAKSQNNDVMALCNVTVTPFVMEAIDLGLSVKWAKCNLGAYSQLEDGDYYAWGETSTKYQFNYTTYKFYRQETTMEDDIERTYSGYTKYVTDSRYGFQGFVDNKRRLDLADDAAHVILGGDWRMPTIIEAKELIEKCNWEQVTYKGVKGCMITSKVEGYTDKWIFLSSAAHIDGFYFEGTCDYWTSVLSDSPARIDIRNNEAKTIHYNTLSDERRCAGLPIRAVCE